ncbi:hypothetical protein [Burkholderia pseudomallei]|uniref:hypothetical protein n=1 Tax=Burkholderia pseudomallei TaxID=28450 RepID=UPI0009759CDF|nr:hypothetical protein [Burkholderia pseudomallei]MBM5620418.1 hypothetical protein [Burkholderia pseudomallei]MBM5634814.1 hypothetical protein [Burkholderia pseudomallei]MBM5663210.1 hypothetical protein [Burkholderia pseudomallei]OMZ35856.1 hypothetical protein AQ862_06545 [Burkholderia pseudomallei]
MPMPIQRHEIEKVTGQYRSALDAITMRQADSLGMRILLVMTALAGFVDATRRQDTRINAQFAKERGIHADRVGRA